MNGQPLKEQSKVMGFKSRRVILGDDRDVCVFFFFFLRHVDHVHVLILVIANHLFFKRLHGFFFV